jgi:cystathionine gamma-synthase
MLAALLELRPADELPGGSCTGGMRKWLAEFALTWGLDVELTDTTDLDAVAAAIRPGRTRTRFAEGPQRPGRAEPAVRHVDAQRTLPGAHGGDGA